LSAARWDLAQAEAEEQLREVDAGNRYLDLVAEVAAADAEYTGVQLELEAQEELGERRVFSEIEVERTRLRAQQLLRRLEAERARLERFSDSREAEADASQARLSRLREQVQRLESRVADLSVAAGVAGVVQEVNVQEGERLGSGHVIARVVNTEQLMARVNVAERDAAQVMVGMPVSLEIGRLEETGTVVRIDPTVRDRLVHVDVALEDAQLDRLRPDLSVTARIELERVNDVLVMDRPAGLRDEFEALRLFRLIESGERARATNVKIGRVSARQVEVLEGLSAGDRVILADMTEWREEPLLRIR
jgi:multidrug efflux pump subunit AcrA (membrane-fusion protein)